MIKVMWFLKRAEGLTLEAFRDWWLNHDAHDVARHQAPHLLRYVVNVRRDDSGLGGKPADDQEWDGVAEQWFADEAAYMLSTTADLAPRVTTLWPTPADSPAGW